MYARLLVVRSDSKHNRGLSEDSTSLANRDDKQMIKTNGINHVVLHVKDAQRSKQFYTALLGMTVAHESPQHVFLNCGTQQVALFERPDGDSLETGNDLNHLALDIADGSYQEIKAELEGHDIEVTGRPGDPHCVYFHDPDGHRLQLMVHSS